MQHVDTHTATKSARLKREDDSAGANKNVFMDLSINSRYDANSQPD